MDAARRQHIVFISVAWLGISGALLSGTAGRGIDEPPQGGSISGLAGNRYIPAVQQSLSPLGVQVDLPGLRPQVIRLSPDGKLLAVSGQTSELILVDPVSGTITQRVSLPGENAAGAESAAGAARLEDSDRLGQVSYTGLVFLS